MQTESSAIKLIVGLGNPGAEYDKTRHNAGAWFIERLAEQNGVTLRPEKKFQSLSADMQISGKSCRLLLPTTFMNHSGQAVKGAAQFYKLPPSAVLVAHDDLDLPAGEIRIKQDGGHGGHNGLRDIINHFASKTFWRVRIGIGHPGHKDKVLNYVLGRPSIHDAKLIHQAIDMAIDALPNMLNGDTQKAMQALHTRAV